MEAINFLVFVWTPIFFIIFFGICIELNGIKNEIKDMGVKYTTGRAIWKNDK